MSKPGKSLKAMCKKLGVRLTVKRGKKRVYKSIKVLKRQCANKKKKKVKRIRKFGVLSLKDLAAMKLSEHASYSELEKKGYPEEIRRPVYNASRKRELKHFRLKTPHQNLQRITQMLQQEQRVVAPFINLQGAWLEEANLKEANLRGANLKKAILYNANLQNANLKNAYLQKTYLRKANLQGANLQGANLQGANLTHSKLHNTDLKGANLRGAILYNVELHNADLKGANLRGANVEESFLIEADLQGADLRETSFKWANLLGAKYNTEPVTIDGKEYGKTKFPREFHLQERSMIDTNSFMYRCIIS
jgi:hypothetical protein